MADVSNIRSFIQKWEGGLSRNTADSASKNPAPWSYKGLTGWHTNKGVTYTTFVGQAPKIGYAVTPENFFLMPDNIWDGIIKNGYFNPWALGSMKSQAIADLILDFAWGSGVGGSFKIIKAWLATKGFKVSNTAQAVDAINKLSALNEENTFLELVQLRESFFKHLSDFPVFGKGWLKRLNELKSFGLETISKKKIKIAIAVLIVITALVTIIYFTTKK